MLKQYYTVKQAGSHEIVIQKSRFIGYVERVHTEEEAIQFVQKIRKKHHDATHNCFAYIVGENVQIQKANDDGEPGGTAGVPMLEVLRRLKLKNIAVVATRYFGGIKLGAGGLIRAYSTITSETLQHVGIVKGDLMQGVSITIDYSLLGKVENLVRQPPYVVHDIHYLENVELIVYIPIDDVDTCFEQLIDLTNNQIELKKTNQTYIETDVSLNHE